MNRLYRIFSTILLSVMLLVLTPATTYAATINLGELTESAIQEDNPDDVLADAVDKDIAKSSFIDDIFDTISNATANIGVKLGTACTTFIVDSFSPDFNTFVKVFNPDMDNTKDNNAQTNSVFGYLFFFAKVMGLIIAFLLFVWNMLIFFFGKQEQIKASPIQTLISLGVACGLIWVAYDIVYVILDFAGRLWDKFVVTSGGSQLSFTRILASTSFVDGLLGKIACLNIGYTIIKLILTWVIFKNFLKLYLEMAERYLVMVLMLALIPIGLGFLVAPESSRVTKSYIKMTLSEVFLVVFGGVLMKVFVVLVMASNVHILNPLIVYIIMLAYLKFACRFDFYMAQLGLNTAQTNGMLLNEIGGAFRSMIGTAKSLGAKADTNARNIGRAEMATGLATGNENLFRQGFMRGKDARLMNSATNGAYGTTVAHQSFMEGMDKKQQMQRREGDSLMESSVKSNNFADYKRGFVMKNGATPDEQIRASFNSAVAKRDVLDTSSAGSTWEMGIGEGQYSFGSLMDECGLDSDSLNRLEEDGLDLSDVGFVQQLSSDHSDYSFIDDDGNSLASVRNGETFVNTDGSAPKEFSDTQLSAAFGSAVGRSESAETSTGFGTMTYSGMTREMPDGSVKEGQIVATKLAQSRMSGFDISTDSNSRVIGDTVVTWQSTKEDHEGAAEPFENTPQAPDGATRDYSAPMSEVNYPGEPDYGPGGSYEVPSPTKPVSEMTDSERRALALHEAEMEELLRYEREAGIPAGDMTPINPGPNGHHSGLAPTRSRHGHRRNDLFMLHRSQEGQVQTREKDESGLHIEFK